MSRRAAAGQRPGSGAIPRSAMVCRLLAACLTLLPVLGVAAERPGQGPTAASPAAARPVEGAAPRTASPVGAPEATVAIAAPVVRMRGGDHPGYGRIVLDLPAGVAPVVVRAGAGVIIRLSGAALGPVPHLPRNVGAIEVDGAEASILPLAGARLRIGRLPGRVLLDWYDPVVSPGNAAARLPAAPRPSGGANIDATPGANAGSTSGAVQRPGAAPEPGRPSPASQPVSVPPPARSLSRPPPPARPRVPEPRPGPVAQVSAAPPAWGEPGPGRPFRDPWTGGANPVPRPSPGSMPNPDGVGPGPSSPSEPREPGIAAPGPAAPVPLSPSADARLAPLPATTQPASRPPASLAAPLPVSARAGMAALRRGDLGLIVADVDAAADPAAWRAVPGLAAATIRNLPDAVVITVPLLPGQALRLTHGPQGWTLGDPAAEPGSLDLATRPGGLLIAAPAASRVVSIADPLGGGVLLVGTERAGVVLTSAAPEPAAPGSVVVSTGPEAARPDAVHPKAVSLGAAHVEVGRVLPELALLPTWLGVAVEPLSDRVDMRAQAEGFALRAGDPPSPALPVVVALPDVALSAPLSREFDLPDLPLSALQRRLAAANDSASAAPPRARAEAQLRLAQALLALGLGTEAQAVLQLATEADARVQQRPAYLALRGAAALVAGHPPQTPALDDPMVAETDEAAMWRALCRAARADADGLAPPADAARVLARTRVILLSYPEPLRARLLPVLAETLAQGGEPAVARAVLADPADNAGAAVDFARALLVARTGSRTDALAAFDRVAASRDRRDRVRAAARAVELRLQAGSFTPAQAADALDALIAAWRGDDAELALRLRVAELRLRGGQARAALAILRESRGERLAVAWSPSGRERLADRTRATFAAAISDDLRPPLPPLDFLSIVEDNADQLPPGPEGEVVARRVADGLTALDLPDRAVASLGRMIAVAPEGAGRALLGERLALMQLQQGDGAAALSALSATTAPDLPAALLASRTLAYARAMAADGQLTPALGALAALATPEADALRADLLGRAGRWAEAAALLARQVARDVPPQGRLTPAQVGLVLRLASAATQAGQGSVLEQTRRDVAERLPPGHESDLLRLLVAGPVRSVSDLGRAASEETLARQAMR